MDEKKNDGGSLARDKNDNVQLPIGPDSPEQAQLDELVSMMNVLIENASSGQERSAADGLMDILAVSSVPKKLKYRILSHYRKVCERPDFRLSDLIIEGDFLKGLLELGSQIDATGEYEDQLHRLIGYSRHFIESRLQASSLESESGQSQAIPPQERLRADTEALVASSPFRNFGILDYFKKTWRSGVPQKLDYSETTKKFNAHWQEIEIEKARQLARGKRTEKMNLQRVPTEEEVPATPETAVFVGPGFNVEPASAKTLKEGAQAESIQRKTIREPREEKTLVEKIIFIFEYDKPLEALDPRHLNVNDVIYCETAAGPVYEFLVKDKIDNFVDLEGVNGRYTGSRFIINAIEPIVLNGAIKFIKGGQINGVRTLEVRKKATLSKMARKSGIQTAVREEMELEEEDSEVAAIGDSNGNFEAYQSNLKLFKVIDDNGHWIAKNKKVVIHGDILADRNAEGFKILDHISNLKAEAKKTGGEVVVIAGNHEDFMFSFLLGKKVANPAATQGTDEDSEENAEADKSRNNAFNSFYQCREGEGSKNGPQGSGLLELTQYTGDRKMIGSFTDAMEAYEERLIDALPAMRKDPRGIRLLREMCEMKLCEQIGGAIFIHTDPTNKILKSILEIGVEEINKRFQGILKRCLVEGEPYDSSFDFLFDTFLFTNNRTFANYVATLKKTGKRELGLDRDLIRRIKERGVNTIIFGHSDLGEGKRSIPVDGVTFVNVDQGAGKTKGKAITKASGAIIDTKGVEKPRTGTVVMAMSEVEKGEKDKK